MINHLLIRTRCGFQPPAAALASFENMQTNETTRRLEATVYVDAGCVKAAFKRNVRAQIRQIRLA